MNKVTLYGRLGNDPETKTLPSGSIVTNFSLATSERYTDKEGNRQEKTEWHNISAFGKQGEVVSKFLKKGDPFLMEGKISYNESVKEDGSKTYFTSIILQSFTFVGGGGKEGSNSNQHGNDTYAQLGVPKNNPTPAPRRDDDLPF